MKATVRHERALRFVATNEQGHETAFDTSVKGGGLNSAASPMETVLEAVAACSSMDVVSILQKRHHELELYQVELTSERAVEHPKVFTSIHLSFHLRGVGLQEKEVRDAITLSQTKYCSVSIMLARGGVAISWDATIEDSVTGTRVQFAMMPSQTMTVH